MPHAIFQVDAFSSVPFKGNPAAVMLLDTFFPDAVMQNIAMENNLSETAFVVPREDGSYDLRWFTPTLEIEFCGHATVATAHVLATEYNCVPPFRFHTQVGELRVGVSEKGYDLDAPVFAARAVDISSAMRAAFPVELTGAFEASDNLFVVFAHEADIAAFEPDMSLIIPLSDHGVGITAQGTGDYDCVSRFFVPAQGIDEDPVTGSAHAAIAPYWAKVLGKNKLIAYQASARGGELFIDVGEERLTISGHAVTYLRGEIKV